MALMIHGCEIWYATLVMLLINLGTSALLTIDLLKEFRELCVSNYAIDLYGATHWRNSFVYVGR